jgi:hypothetical protein
MSDVSRGRGRPRKIRPVEDPAKRQAYFDRALGMEREHADWSDERKALREEFRDAYGVDTSAIDKAVKLALNDSPARIEAFKATVAAMEEFNVVRFDPRTGQGNVFAALEPPAHRQTDIEEHIRAVA